jgi:hypothetical protein
MTVRPILFSAPMVRALLAGQKTQTRRLAWRPACFVGDRATQPDEHITYGNVGSTPVPLSHPPSLWQRVQPGDVLWVREAHRLTDCPCTDACRGAGHVFYDADLSGYRNVEFNKQRPSIHMPRWASRLTLEVTAVRIERLTDISEADCGEEGVAAWAGPAAHPRVAFALLWDAVNGKGAWDRNPEVVALTFIPRLLNIDDLLARRAAA